MPDRKHRPSLHVHCYRMLGSLHDADDALQESLIRAWRAIDCFEGRSSLHSWLYRITTNVCLDLIARRQKRVLPIDYCQSADPAAVREGALADDIWIEPYPDEALATDVPTRRLRRATRSAKASNSRSSRRCSICPRVSERR